MSLAKRTSSGILWNFFEQLARKGIGIFVTLILAYFLTPEAYGLVAMMAVFLALGSSIMQSGFNQALIRMPDVTQTDYNTAFFANIALGVFAYLLLFLTAPFIAGFYDEAQLVLLIRIAALSIIINAFQVVQQASLSRALNFKAQVKAVLPASTISGIAAIGLAYLGWGVWALVGQMLLAALLQTVFLWIVQGWRPTRDFSIPTLKEMYGFGYKLFLSGVLDTIFQNLYVLVVAKLFSTTIAGLYYFAHQIKQLVIQQLVMSIQTVTYPALSKLQNDDENLRRGYSRVISVSTFLLFPAMLFLAVMTEPLFAIFLPDKWFTAASYLQLMCIAAMIYPLNTINLNILKVKGRSDLFLYLEIIKKFVAVVIILISYRWGVYGLLIGQVVSSMLAYLPNSYYSSKLIDYGVKEQFRDYGAHLALAVMISLLAVVVYHVFEIASFSMVFAVLPLMGFTYLFISFLFRKDDFLFLVRIFKKNKRTSS
ncbi:flippase [Aliidiomarina shirensis]|uniref:Flippase n=1 Tax=Aliidiomarina shirensis TaxID=1048642 RepID=A0A432WU82_9GAMM|nr:lipopolysaccharide biosynthesis protein [Aliidiomarina shirensis]RUO37308.1 flippase [Aliidiomarina shirensis]